MLAEVNFRRDSTLEAKRERMFSTQPQEHLNFPRKRQPKNSMEDQNPYQAIPWLPQIKLSLEEMNSDPIAIFIRLEQKYKQFGAVKVSTCDEWKCPFQQRFVDKGITTRIQQLSKLKQGKAFEQNVEAYSFHSYQTYSMNFERNYKYKTQPRGKTVQSKKQFEYWSLVTKPEYEKSNVKVQYAADLASTKYGSGFPIHPTPRSSDQHFCYEANLFNLNNIMNSPSSVLGMTLERKEKVSGITHPWVYMGALFSSFCWHVEDLGVNSLNYNHKGGIKTWYVVPGSHKANFDSYVKEKYCINSHKQTLLNRITFMIDPLQLIKAGIPVYKTYQRPRDFVCTFFHAYHCGFSQGYNIGEAVNFLSPLSIQVMKKTNIQKKLNPKSPPNVIPIDWIIYQNFSRLKQFKLYEEKIKEAYLEMINTQKNKLKEIKEKYNITKLIIFPGIRKYDRLYCSTCKQYLYLHAFKFNDNKIYCIQHLKKQVPENSKLTILLREPNDDRKYIENLFNKATVQFEDEEVEKRGRSKSTPFMKH